jgi:hypothetical protein
VVALLLIGALSLYSENRGPGNDKDKNDNLTRQGQNIFRNDTFGDQDFWGGTLHCIAPWKAACMAALVLAFRRQQLLPWDLKLTRMHFLHR